MLCSTKLKITLQSNITYLFLLVFIIIYIFITTIIIKYETKIYGNTIEGIITDMTVNEKNISFVLKGREKVKCNYYVDNADDYSSLLGKRVRITGSPKDLYNNTIPNTFNYKRYLYNNKIYLSFKVENLDILEKENIFYKLKNKIVNKLNSYDDLTKTYLNMFIIGNNNFLSDNIYETYRVNGIWHLFAISGSHISLIILVLDKLLKKIKFKNVIISAVLYYFMFLTNFSASVLRTTVFYFLKIIFEFLNINLDSKILLFLTAFIILLINPFMIYNVGFQYSFLISFAIMLESKYITGHYFKKTIKMSLISFIVSLPITINMNYEINFLSILLNVFYVPFISFVVFPVSVLSFTIPFLSPLLKMLIYILEFTNQFFYNFKLSIIIPKIFSLTIILYYIMLFLFHKNRKKKYLLVILSLLIINIVMPKLDGNFNVYFLDVNQGDSSLLISPYKNEVVMIDTGGIVNSDYHISNNTILFLKSMGLSKINSLIITHGDYDHMGEAINLVNNFKVEKVIFNCGDFNKLETDLIKVLDKKRIPYYSCIKELNIDNNKLYFLDNKDYGNENDNSSVIYTELNSHKFLFMGDAGVEVEEDLIEKYNLQDIDVLKVGHHGSRTSSDQEFINKINPKYSIISVGKNNRYGHPNKEVLNNLNTSKIYRTDQDGSVMFKIKNTKLMIETCSS